MTDDIPPASPIRPTDDVARDLGKSLMKDAQVGALAVIDPETGAPFVSRIGLSSHRGSMIGLISELSAHTRALRANPEASLLVGEIADRGDPLNHPRLTLQVVAEFVSREASGFDDLRAAYLERNPKARLYIDFADFHLVRFRTRAAFLNGGFGKAFRMTPEDLAV